LVDPGTTMRRGTACLFVVIAAIAKTFDSDALVRLTSTVCGPSAVASVVLSFAFPPTGDFRAVFSQKNALAQAMVVGVLARAPCDRCA
jgi:hypothetical protein